MYNAPLPNACATCVPVRSVRAPEPPMRSGRVQEALTKVHGQVSECIRFAGWAEGDPASTPLDNLVLTAETLLRDVLHVHRGSGCRAKAAPSAGICSIAARVHQKEGTACVDDGPEALAIDGVL